METRMLHLFVFLMLVLSACSQQTSALPESVITPEVNQTADTTKSESDELSASSATECPQATAGQPLARNEAAGYCFTIPGGFETEVSPETFTAVVLAPATTPGHRERLLIYVEPALGRSLTQVTDQIQIDYTVPGMESEASTNVSLGGELATVITGLTGQDPNRRVLTIHDDRVYELMFIPDQPADGEAYEEMVAVFETVMESFIFTEPTSTMDWPSRGWSETGYPADAVMYWEHRKYGDGGAITECLRLSVAEAGTTWAGSCAQVEVEVTTPPFQWAEILSRFEPFVFKGGNWDMYFVGQGELYDPAWVTVLGAWAQATHEEASDGRTSATGRTALSWWLGQTSANPDICQHLIVLSHGYATANLDPCSGGSSQVIAEGWLKTAEVTPFSRWISTYMPSYWESSYLDGRGDQVLGLEDIDQLELWAQEVYQRLLAENGQ